MKLFHLSDLHIGKRVNEFSMLEDQKYILRQILKHFWMINCRRKKQSFIFHL